MSGAGGGNGSNTYASISGAVWQSLSDYGPVSGQGERVSLFTGGHMPKDKPWISHSWARLRAAQPTLCLNRLQSPAQVARKAPSSSVTHDSLSQPCVYRCKEKV